jgi:sugar phosphate isomerase/epimerase
MKSSVTISLVPAARGGPFVYWDDLPAAAREAAALGFDGIEVFPPSAESIDRASLETLLDDLQLRLAAVGTGAGWVVHRLTLTDPDDEQRERARRFVESMIDFAGHFGAPAIIGSMQGRSANPADREQVLTRLRRELDYLGNYAARHKVPLIYEPLNRYETNLCNTLEAGAELLDSLATDNVVLLADLFHMNLEESDLGAALCAAGSRVGHLHFVDSNRQAVGCGHLDLGPVMAALRAIGYRGFLSAEALPVPNSSEAARQTVRAFQYWTHSSVPAREAPVRR